MIGPTTLPVVWAQAPGANPNTLAPLALRRWCASLTLSSPEPVPSLFGLWAWLAGLAGLLIVVLVVQGPARAGRQLFDLRGHVGLVSEALGRLRRAGRVVAGTIGMTVVAWTAEQIRSYLADQDEQGRADLLLLTKLRSLAELSVEQGILAGLTPLRDVLSLGSNLPLLVIATVLLFRDSAERRAAPGDPRARGRAGRSGWTNAAWVSTALYLLYRLVSLASGAGGLPLGGCLMFEVIGVPLTMVLSDGIVLAWILVELRDGSLGETGNDACGTDQAVALMPGAALACLAGLPARALATLVLLAAFAMPGTMAATLAGRLMRWQLSWGLADVQGVALMAAGMSGAVAWSRGTLSGAVRGYLRLLSAEGGHLVVAIALACLAAGGASAVAYALILALPPQAWVLAAADSYAHYATLPIGLLTLAACVELGERALPEAALADSGPGEPTRVRSSPTMG